MPRLPHHVTAQTISTTCGGSRTDLGNQENVCRLPFNACSPCAQFRDRACSEPRPCGPRLRAPFGGPGKRTYCICSTSGRCRSASTGQTSTPAGSKGRRYAPKDICSSIEIVLCQERDQLAAGRFLPDGDELRQDLLDGAQGFRLIAIDELDDPFQRAGERGLV